MQGIRGGHLTSSLHRYPIERLAFPSPPSPHSLLVQACRVARLGSTRGCHYPTRREVSQSRTNKGPDGVRRSVCAAAWLPSRLWLYVTADSGWMGSVRCPVHDFGTHFGTWAGGQPANEPAGKRRRRRQQQQHQHQHQHQHQQHQHQQGSAYVDSAWMPACTRPPRRADGIQVPGNAHGAR